jgi:hypothetical protein
MICASKRLTALTVRPDQDNCCRLGSIEGLLQPAVPPQAGLKVAPIEERREPPCTQKRVDIRRVALVDTRIAHKNVERFGLQGEVRANQWLSHGMHNPDAWEEARIGRAMPLLLIAALAAQRLRGYELNTW